jgi:hypothetical protein
VPEEGKTYLQLNPEDIEDITIGFNATMHHIFLALNPEFVGLAPFPPVIHHSLDIKTRDLGIKINPSSYMFVLPIEAGFVGADKVGVLIAEEPYKHEENQLIIDRCVQQEGSQGLSTVPEKPGHQPVRVYSGLGRRIPHRQGYRYYTERHPANSAGQGCAVCRMQNNDQTHGVGKGRQGQDSRCLWYSRRPNQGLGDGIVFPTVKSK